MIRNFLTKKKCLFSSKLSQSTNCVLLERKKLLSKNHKKCLRLFSKDEKDIEKDIERMKAEFLGKQDFDDRDHFKVVSNKSKMPDRGIDLNLHQVKIQDPMGERDPEFERPRGVLDINNPDLSEKSGFLMIDEIQTSGFLLGDIYFPGSLLVFTHQVFLWDVAHPEDIRPHVFDFIRYIKPRPGN